MAEAGDDAVGAAQAPLKKGNGDGPKDCCCCWLYGGAAGLQTTPLLL